MGSPLCAILVEFIIKPIEDAIYKMNKNNDLFDYMGTLFRWYFYCLEHYKRALVQI